MIVKLRFMTAAEPVGEMVRAPPQFIEMARACLRER